MTVELVTTFEGADSQVNVIVNNAAVAIGQTNLAMNGLLPAVKERCEMIEFVESWSMREATWQMILFT